jgi:hypothetical protein
MCVELFLCIPACFQWLVDEIDEFFNEYERLNKENDEETPLFSYEFV